MIEVTIAYSIAREVLTKKGDYFTHNKKLVVEYKAANQKMLEYDKAINNLKFEFFAFSLSNSSAMDRSIKLLQHIADRAPAKILSLNTVGRNTHTANAVINSDNLHKDVIHTTRHARNNVRQRHISLNISQPRIRALLVVSLPLYGPTP